MRSNLPSPGTKYVYKCLFAIIAYVLFKVFIFEPYSDEPIIWMVNGGICLLLILWALNKN